MTRDFAPAITARKKEIRDRIRGRLRALSPAERAEASLMISARAAQLPEFRRAKVVALFAPLPTEPDIHPLIEEAWAEGKVVVLPQLDAATGTLEWRAVTAWEQLIGTGPFGLREPEAGACPRVEPARLELIFVPGLAFDSTGMRLGRGGGYYDRCLAELPLHLSRCGLMFALQKVESLPRAPHDQALPAVTTEEGVLMFSDASDAGVRSIQPPPST